MNVLLPKLLDKNEAAYKSVEELNRAITLAMKEKKSKEYCAYRSLWFW